MKILHIFDDYGTPGERALAGERSVPTVVYHLAKFPKEEEIDGIRYIRINADYKLIKSPVGLARLLRDGFDIAVKMSRFLKEKNLIKELIKHFNGKIAARRYRNETYD